jgi:hypothetical protein
MQIEIGTAHLFRRRQSADEEVKGRCNIASHAAVIIPPTAWTHPLIRCREEDCAIDSPVGRRRHARRGHIYFDVIANCHRPARYSPSC